MPDTDDVYWFGFRGAHSLLLPSSKETRSSSPDCLTTAAVVRSDLRASQGHIRAECRIYVWGDTLVGS